MRATIVLFVLAALLVAVAWSDPSPQRNDSPQNDRLEEDQETEKQGGLRRCKGKPCRKIGKPSIRDNKKIMISGVSNAAITNTNLNNKVGGSKIMNIGNTHSDSVKNANILNYNIRDQLTHNLHNDTGGIRRIDAPLWRVSNVAVDNSKTHQIRPGCPNNNCPLRGR